MGHSQTNQNQHIIFSTKNREPLITEEIESRLHAYMGGFIREHGGIALIVNGTANHVHILAGVRVDKALSGQIRDLKSNATGWVHRTFPEYRHFSWQQGYGAFTVSRSQVSRVQRYIANQKVHHQKQTFEDEYMEILRAHEIEFDEKYLWD